jgi:hypothetical protein
MNSLISVATILALFALAEGSLVIAVPGLTSPAVNRGIEGSSR